MADRLEALLNHFSVRPQRFDAGRLCGVNDVPAQGALGQLHLIRSGIAVAGIGGAAPVGTGGLGGA